MGSASSKQARKLFVGGNWKCNGSLQFIKEFPETCLNTIKYDSAKVEILIAPTSVHLPTAMKTIKNDIHVSAQNISKFGNGAYTGEVSAEMLNDINCDWTILGHSERRHIFGESDEVIGDKTKVALDHNLNVIACIGEQLDEREAGKTMEVNERQLNAIKEKIDNWDNIVIAYEPVWAIGTGKTASPEQAQEVHAGVRDWLSKNVSKDAAEKTRILYGGSVTEKNAEELITKPDVDGFLVGGASLKDALSDIVKACNDAKKN